MTDTKSLFTVKALTRIAVLGALAGVLEALNFPLPFMPPWLSLDFSEIGPLMGTFAMGPLAGTVIELIKNAIKILISGSFTGGVGELGNFMMGAAYVIPAGLIYAREHTRKGAVKGLAVGVVSATAVSVLLNYLLLMPMYGSLMGLDLVAIMSSVNPAADSLLSIALLGVLPFNLIKFTAVSAITMLVYKPLSPLLKV